MGDHNVEEFDRHKSQLFMKAVLDDLRALAFMLENNLVESGIRRLGAEQANRRALDLEIFCGDERSHTEGSSTAGADGRDACLSEDRRPVASLADNQNVRP